MYRVSKYFNEIKWFAPDRVEKEKAKETRYQFYQYEWFNTHEEGKQHIIARLKAEIKNKEQDIVSLKRRLSKAEAMQEKSLNKEQP